MRDADDQVEGRIVRTCPKHGAELEERGDKLVCPTGKHVVKAWDVADKSRRMVIAEAGEKGWVGDVLKPLVEKPALQPHKKVLAVQHFVSKGKRMRLAHVHFLRMGQHRIGYEITAQDGKKSSGWTGYKGPDEKAASAAFGEALRRARLRGWQDTQPRAFGRQVELTEIPAAY